MDLSHLGSARSDKRFQYAFRAYVVFENFSTTISASEDIVRPSGAEADKKPLAHQHIIFLSLTEHLPL